MLILISAELAFSAPETSSERFSRCTEALFSDVMRGVGEGLCMKAIKRVNKKSRKKYKTGQAAACSTLAHYILSTNELSYRDLIQAEVSSYLASLLDPELDFFKERLVAYAETSLMVYTYMKDYSTCMYSRKK